MNVTLTYLCQECGEVQDRCPTGRCVKCGSEDVFPLTRLLESKYKRAKWFEKFMPKPGSDSRRYLS